jgi:hypothetical protein
MISSRFANSDDLLSDAARTAAGPFIEKPRLSTRGSSIRVENPLF